MWSSSWRVMARSMPSGAAELLTKHDDTSNALTHTLTPCHLTTAQYTVIDRLYIDTNQDVPWLAPDSSDSTSSTELGIDIPYTTGTYIHTHTQTLHTWSHTYSHKHTLMHTQTHVHTLVLVNCCWQWVSSPTLLTTFCTIWLKNQIIFGTISSSSDVTLAQ